MLSLLCVVCDLRRIVPPVCCSATRHNALQQQHGSSGMVATISPTHLAPHVPLIRTACRAHRLRIRLLLRDGLARRGPGSRPRRPTAFMSRYSESNRRRLMRALHRWATVRARSCTSTVNVRLSHCRASRRRRARVLHCAWTEVPAPQLKQNTPSVSFVTLWLQMVQHAAPAGKNRGIDGAACDRRRRGWPRRQRRRLLLALEQRAAHRPRRASPAPDEGPQGRCIGGHERCRQRNCHHG